MLYAVMIIMHTPTTVVQMHTRRYYLWLHY